MQNNTSARKPRRVSLKWFAAGLATAAVLVAILLLLPRGQEKQQDKAYKIIEASWQEIGPDLILFQGSFDTGDPNEQRILYKAPRDMRMSAIIISLDDNLTIAGHFAPEQDPDRLYASSEDMLLRRGEGCWITVRRLSGAGDYQVTLELDK